MLELQQAIADEFKENINLFGLAAGNIFVGRAPQKKEVTALSEFIVVHIISQTVDEEYVYARRLEFVRVQFSIYSKKDTTERINELFKALTEVFDRVTLTFRAETWRNINMKRETSSLMRQEDGVWFYMVDYRIWLQPVTSTTSP